MKRWFRSRWLWLALLLAIIPVGAVLWLRQSTVNVMHPALDELSKVKLSERWSHPQMLKIRELGVKAVPSLRRVLREKEQPSTRFLLWVKAKWPGVTKYYSRFPDPNKLKERRWVACQALRTLGPAGRSAAPELIEILKSNDLTGLNAATMALHAVGIDADVCDRLDALLEMKVVSESGRAQIVNALGNVKPPSARTLKVLVAALTDPSAYVPYRSAETLGRLGVHTPEIVSALKRLQSNTTNELAVVASSAALWKLDKDAEVALPPVLKVLESELSRPLAPYPARGESGQGVSAGDQLFMAAGEMFRGMDLRESDKLKALALLESWGEKSERVFIRMLLLPAMMDLGFSGEKCLEVCKTGLNQPEVYYRIQAARLLAMESDKHSLNALDLNPLIRDPDVGVRVYAAKIHWLKNRQVKAVVPVLIESLDHSRHQSYYYAEIQPVALTVLGDIGPDAHEAVGTLEKLIRDPNPTVAKLASEALVKIRK